MAIDPHVVEKVRRSALELALLEARLACAAPEERERLLQATGRNGVRPDGVEEFADALDEAEWAQFLAEYKAERQGSAAELDELLSRW